MSNIELNEETKNLYRTAAQVKLTLSGKMTNSQRFSIGTSREAADFCRAMFDPEALGRVEHFYLITLNAANKVLGWSLVSIGGLNGTVADVRIIAQTALLQNASCLILCHNHPSGAIRPSDADIRLTRKIKEALDWLDIKVLDHIILTDEDEYYSFADSGSIL